MEILLAWMLVGVLVWMILDSQGDPPRNHVRSRPGDRREDRA